MKTPRIGTPDFPQTPGGETPPRVQSVSKSLNKFLSFRELPKPASGSVGQIFR